VPLRHGEFCEYGVHMGWFEGTLFFMWDYEAMVQTLRLEKDNIIVFELDINFIHFTLLRAHSSTQLHMKCKRHGLMVAK
jgi:hypothetical protein